MKMCALLPICTSIATNAWFGILGNNSLLSFVNDIFPFIATHCASSMRIVLVLVYIDQFAVSLFILMRTYHFFDTIPSVQVHHYVYKSLIGFLTFLTVLYVLASAIAPNDAFRVMIYDDRQYRQCELAFATEGPVIFPWLVISQNVIQFSILTLCIKKLFDFKEYCAEAGLSKYFSGKVENDHVVYRFLFACIGYIISYWACFVILAYCQWTFFSVSIGIKVLAITCSFDVYPATNYDLRLVHTTPSRTKDVQVTQNYHTTSALPCTTTMPMRLTARSRRGRYSQTRDYSHSCSHTYSRSHSTSHSHLLEIFEEEYKEDMCAKYDVHVEFVESCKTIFDALSQVFIPQIYAHIIAEYAATQYVYCMDCQDVFGCIECRRDYVIDCGGSAVENGEGQIRYYL